MFPTTLDVLQSANGRTSHLEWLIGTIHFAHPAQEAKYDLLQRNILEMEEKRKGSGARRQNKVMCYDAWKVALSGIALELKAACDHSDSLVARGSGPAQACSE